MGLDLVVRFDMITYQNFRKLAKTFHVTRQPRNNDF